MSKKQIIYAVALLVVVIFLVSGCGGTQISTVDSPKVIQTYGEAEVKAEPEVAKISLAIQTRGTSAVEVAEENARLANAVMEALKNFGLAEEDIKTGSYSLYSYREWFDGRPEGGLEVITFQAVNEILVTTDNLETVGEIIDLAIRSGANNINYINFELKDPQELLMQALAMASEQASKKAEAIANSTGDSITGLHSIREERADYIPYRFGDSMMQEEMAMGGAPTPISPDLVTVRASVVAEFTIR